MLLNIASDDSPPAMTPLYSGLHMVPALAFQLQWQKPIPVQNQFSNSSVQWFIHVQFL